MGKKRKVEQEVVVKKEEVLKKEEEEEESEEEEEAEGNGNENGEVEEDDIKKLLEPFTKDQLIEILQGLASNDEEILAEIRKKADKDPAHRKVFVRGLGWDTTSQTLQSVFSKYGELEECTVIMDKASSKSKGYGFVTFAHMDGAQRALKEPSKKIDGRMTACQMASAGPPPANPPKELTGRKIYVSNVPQDISADKLLKFFSKYGEVEEGPLGFDKQSGKSRGYALFIYRTFEGAKRALEEPNKRVDGHSLHCKRAADGHNKQNNKPAVSVPLDSNDLALTRGGGSILGSAGSHGVLSVPQSFNQGGNHPGFSQTFNAILASQNPNLAGLNPSVFASFNPSLASSLNPSSLSQSFSQASLGTAGSHGVHPSLGAYGSQLSGLSPGVLGVYGSQAAALQGLNAYQNPQLGQSQVPRSSQLPH